MSRRPKIATLTALATLALSLAFGATQASAASPWWHLTSRMIPTHLTPGGEATIVLQAIDLGNAPTAGNYSFSDELPPGLSLKESHFFARPSKAIEVAHKFPPTAHPDFGPSSTEFEGELAAAGYCKASSSELSCSSESPLEGSGSEFLLQSVVPYDFLEMRLKVKDEGAASGALDEFSASGGGAPSAQSRRAVPIQSGPAGFGLEEFSLFPEEEGGQADTRTGSHPYQADQHAELQPRQHRPLPAAGDAARPSDQAPARAGRQRHGASDLQRTGFRPRQRRGHRELLPERHGDRRRRGHGLDEPVRNL